jgi:predicted flap endonuclease-1-like 5' DNA nuclease
MFTISGAVAGAALGAAIANTLNLWDWVSWLLVIGLAILFAVLVWIFRDEMVIVITALAGAGIVSDGLRTMFGEGTIRNLIWWLIFFALAALGIVFQWSRFRRLQLYRQIGKAADQAVASGTAADLAAQSRAAAATATATGVAVAGGATAAATSAAMAAKREADQAAANAAAAAEQVAAATVDVSATAAAAAAPKLTLEERQAMINQHLDELLSGEGDRSNLGEDLSFLKDLSPDQEAKLKGAGLAVVIDILRRGATAAGRAELSRSTGVPESTILKWVNFADLLRIKGVGAVYARLLEAAGVDTVVELAQRNPVNLHARLVEVNAEQKLSGRDPRQEEVTDWVAQAKELPRIVEY